MERESVRLLQQLPGVKVEGVQEEVPPRVSKSGRKIVVKPYDEKVYAKAWQKKILQQAFTTAAIPFYPSKETQSEVARKTGLGLQWQSSYFQYQRKLLKREHGGKLPASVADTNLISREDDTKEELSVEKIKEKLDREIEKLQSEDKMISPAKNSVNMMFEDVENKAQIDNGFDTLTLEKKSLPFNLFCNIDD